MAKVILTMDSAYCGVPQAKVELEYDGTEKDFDNDHRISTEILSMLACGEFSGYELNWEFIPDEEDEDNEE